jgi:hypothetical protein
MKILSTVLLTALMIASVGCGQRDTGNQAGNSNTPSSSTPVTPGNSDQSTAPTNQSGGTSQNTGDAAARRQDGQK